MYRVMTKKGGCIELNKDIYDNIEALDEIYAVRKRNHNNDNKITRKAHLRWLKIISLELAEQQAASLVSDGIDYDTVARITGLTYDVVQLIANNFTA